MSTQTGADDVLDAFSRPTRTWFTEVFAAPTAPQRGAWQAIARGEHALVIAPTGSGKTLAAFLWALDRLSRGDAVPAIPGDAGAVHPPERPPRTRVLYVSPLKALGVDVERNLSAPLAGIARTAERLGLAAPDITVGVRSGDSTPTERRRLVAHPPDILITTPESLFLMLTSGARDTLTAVDTVIVDEVHAIAASKRGAHLAVSLERLDELLSHSAQRIGLSATVRPPERVARFLGGRQPVTIVAPPAEKHWDLRIVVPVEDMGELATAPGADVADPFGAPQRHSIWPHVERHVYDLVGTHRSSIVFTNSRRTAERLTARLNELHAERLGEQVDTTGPPPAQLMAQSGSSAAVSADVELIARAHHGSVSKEQRARTEADLKSGRLRCVVATSSLELGIDMGAVDLVVQVAAPPSVASGLQRVGRAGHQVGAVSSGVFFPNHRGDLVTSTVVVQRMREGAIEELAELRNPLDVAAQQIVAMTAAAGEEGLGVDDVHALLRRTAPFADLPRSAYEGVLDMLAGRYPSEDFAELRPRLIWQRDTQRLLARPGARRLAVTSGGTIPDRGLFGVFLAGEESGRTGSRRVGELDEEMVYESRVGDVFALGTTSWRIEEITHDRVLVTPAPGQAGRLPFWKGDQQGRPAELGRAYGRFVTATAALPETTAVARLTDAGLDPWAAGNLVGYLAEQREATGTLPSDTTILVERFRDELGDWRVCVHSPLGAALHAPWALAIERTARDRLGVEATATATDDGIVLRIPDTDAEPPGADLVVLDPDEIEQIVTAEVGGSALFAARFRECAARALLLPRRDPGARTPLWQQRMRSAQLLAVAARYPDFPIVLETMRECLQDVFDLPGLLALHRQIAARQVRVVEVETPRASPFAASMLFGYLGSFVYEGDVPLAERKAAALTLDPQLLAELLGSDGLRQLLDPGVIAATEADLQSLSESRRAHTTEQLADLLRTSGPFSAAELAQRWSGDDLPAAVADLVTARRIAAVRIAGVERLASVEDLARLRDGLGVPVPPGLAAAAPDDAARPIHDLALRWARTHGPFRAATLAARYGLGEGVVTDALHDLAADGSVVTGLFTDRPVDALGRAPAEFCHQRVLALIKRRTLALLRHEVEPVEQPAFARFLADWQSVGTPATGALRGADGLLTVVEQLAGYPLPASMIEPVVLPARIADYRPGLLDELIASGEIVWTGAGPIGDHDGWVRLWPADLAADPAAGLVEGPPADDARAAELAGILAGGGSWFFDAALARHPDGSHDRPGWINALWQLVWSGHVTADSFAPVRAFVGAGLLKRPRRPQARTARRGALRAVRPRPPADPVVAGRWSRVGGTGGGGGPADPQARTVALFAQLDRYGVLTRGSVVGEAEALGVDGGFGPAYRALSTLEESGQCRRGYFVAGLGAAQFALPGAVDRLRSAGELPDDHAPEALVLAACDPANPYGAALPWPARDGHRPGRKAGALVVLVDGSLVLYVERGGRTLLSFSEHPTVLGPAAEALAGAVRRGQLGKLTVAKTDGEHALADSPVRAALSAAGFAMTPSGLTVRPRPGAS